MKKGNNLIEIQDLLMKQMKRLDEAVAREINTEVQRSGALSQNAQSYIKSVATSLRVKEMAKNNSNLEKELLKEVGIVEEEV